MRALLDFVSFPRKPGQITSVWAVGTRGVGIGFVSWHSPTRQYVFRPADAGRLYGMAMMRELSEFCERETQGRKPARGRA